MRQGLNEIYVSDIMNKNAIFILTIIYIPINFSFLGAINFPFLVLHVLILQSPIFGFAHIGFLNPYHYSLELMTYYTLNNFFIVEHFKRVISFKKSFVE